MSLRTVSYLNNSLEIILGILEHGERVPYRRKTIGYGLHESNFGKGKIPGTREILRSRSKQFLESKYIKMLKAKDRRSKGYYSITSLGLAFLFQNGIKVTERIFKKTIMNLQFFIKHQEKKSKRSKYDPILDFKLIEEQFKEIDKKILFQILSDIFNQIIIKRGAYQTEISLIHSIDEEIFTVTKRFIIKNKKIYEKNVKDVEITEEELNHDVALFILLSFHYALVIHFIRKEDRKMFESFNIELLKEVNEFNSSRFNEMSPKFDDYINVQNNINKRLKIIS